jgi:hypothetical protein
MSAQQNKTLVNHLFEEVWDKPRELKAAQFSRFQLFHLLALLIGVMSILLSTRAVRAAEGTQSALTATSGQGAGYVVISSTAAGQGTFMAQVTVTIHDAQPNTTFAVTRAVDVPADGHCTSADFLTVATLTTSEGGAGAVHFVRQGGTTDFDVLLRVIGDGTVLQSECMTVIVK